MISHFAIAYLFQLRENYIVSSKTVVYIQDDVDEYMSQSENKSAEAVLRQLEEQHNKYKFMEYNLTTKKSR